MAPILKRRREDEYLGNIERKKDFFPAKAENLLKPYATLWSFSVNSHNCYFRTRNQRKDECMNS